MFGGIRRQGAAHAAHADGKVLKQQNLPGSQKEERGPRAQRIVLDSPTIKTTKERGGQRNQRDSFEAQLKTEKANRAVSLDDIGYRRPPPAYSALHKPPEPEIAGGADEYTNADLLMEFPELSLDKPVPILESHNFEWSRTLWRDASMRTLKLVLVVLVVYFTGGIVGFSQVEGWSYIDTVYYVFATFTTVGYGDMAPKTTTGRLMGMFFILLGISAIGFTISFLMAYFLSLAGTESTQWINEDAVRERQSKDPKYSTVEARLARNTQRALRRRKAAWQKIFVALCKLALTVVGGASVYHYAFGWDFIEACWFCVVTGTTVGYGDVLPTTDSEKLVTIVYMLFGTVLVAQILTQFTDIYVTDFTEDKILTQIEASTKWVHRADLKKEGRITEPEYLLFKLLQMQKVDQDIIRRLQETFWQLDANNTGRIELGEGMDLPSPPEDVEPLGWNSWAWNKSIPKNGGTATGLDRRRSYSAGPGRFQDLPL